MYALLKVIPLFCTTHPLLRITLRHPRWRGFFPLARKEQTMVSFAELKLLFAIIMPQIGWQLPGLLSKNKNMKEMWVIPKSAEWFFTSRPSSCGIIQMSWLSLWIMRAVNPVGQLHGSPTALTSQYLAWDRHCIHVVQTPRVERRIFLKQIETHWNCNKRKSLLAFNNNTTNQIRMKIYCNRRTWYLK